MTRHRISALAAGAICLACGRPAAAQTVEGGRLEIAAGVSVAGALDFGSATAGETTPTMGTLPLFTTSTTLASGAAVEGRVGWRLHRALTAEIEGSYGTPELRITTSSDAENAPSVTAAERIEQYTVGGAVVWHVPIGSRVVPFVTAGAGYLRQLHEGGTLAQTGRYYQFGGGLTVLIATRSNALVKTTGIRIDARAQIRVRGVAFDDAAHLAPAAGASFFVRF